MDAERFARLGEIFAHARELPEDRRTQYLREACGDDDDLRTEIEDLLAEDADEGGDAVDRALMGDAAFGIGLARSRPKQIGRYRILGICGSGGMGTVYEAEQDSPHRRVALKVIQSGVDRPDLLRRFRREAEILARLQHPCIAQIFEAGQFEQDGVSRPFFAMEFVDGAPLLLHATREALSVKSRVALFVRICEAIHYAHSHGVIHRDLKPDNIFVVEESGATTMTQVVGQPKVLDFGVARLADPEQQMTMATGAGQLLGSVPYMSPEQATGNTEQIDARSDLYSLGVVLYELLTGRLPYRVRDRPLVDALHAIRHDEPSRLGSADPELRGDLETIVGKCIEKDPERRYDSVAALIEELERFQRLEPISARPPSTWYQVRKFAQRNRALVGGTLATVLAIAAGAVVAVLFALRAQTHAERSERDAYRANLTSVSALLESDPAQARQVLARIPETQRGWECRYLSAALSGALLEFGPVAPKFEPPAGSPAYQIPQTHDFYLLADASRVLALSAANEFSIWEVRSGRVVRSFAVPGEVRVFAVSRAGNLLAAGLTDGRVVVVDPRREGAAWKTWFESDKDIEDIAVDPVGTRLAIDCEGVTRFGRPGEWSVSSFKRWRIHANPPGLQFDHDGTRLAWLRHDYVTIEDMDEGAAVAHIRNRADARSLAWSPDGKHLACGQHFRSILVFDAASRETAYELYGHADSVTHVAYGGAKRMLSVSDDGTIRIWDLARRETIAVFDAPDTSKAEFVDDEHFLSITGGQLRLWTIAERRVRELDGHKSYVYSVGFSGDGSLLATSSPFLGGATIVWDPLEGQPLRRFFETRQERHAFDASGEHLLFSDRGGVPWAIPLQHPSLVDRWRLLHQPMDLIGWKKGGIMVQRSKLAGVPVGLSVYRTEHGLQKDGRGFLSFVNGIEQMATGQTTPPDLGPNPRLRLGCNLYAGVDAVRIAELIVFDGALRPEASAAIDAYLTARRRGESLALPRLAGDPAVIAHFRADAETVRHGAQNKFVTGWVSTGDPSLALRTYGAQEEVHFYPASANAPASVGFDDPSQSFLKTLLPRVRGKDRLTVCMLGDFSKTSVGGTAYAIGTIQDSFTARDPRILRPWRKQAHSPDGKLVADTSARGTLVVRDKAGVDVARFDGIYHGVSFHPDSTRLAAGADGGEIDIFDVRTRRRLARIEAHASICYDVEYSPDGERIASGGNDNALRIWDAETHEPLLELPGHRSYVMSVAWSPDGTMLASVSGDHGVRIWDSVPRRLRYRQRLGNSALEDEVLSQVEEWRAESPQPEDVLARIRRRWQDDQGRRRAALKVLARLELDR